MQIHEVTLPSEVVGNVAQGALQGAKKAAGAVKQAYGKVGNVVRGVQQGVQQARVGQASAATADRALKVWNGYVKTLQSTQETTPAVLETALRAFIQKNLLGDLKYQYNSLTNVGQIESLIKQIVDPANADFNKQKPLWTKLATTVSVSQAGGQAPGAKQPGGKPGAGSQAGGGVGTSPGEIATAIQDAGVSPGVYKNMGLILRSGGGTVRSTGNPVVDAFLTSLNFNVQ
jgi:hypothetical protein